MKRLSFLQICIMLGLISIGVIAITVDLLSPVITLSIGYTCIFMGALLMVMECGPNFWYWWVPFGLGTRYDIDENLYDGNYETIMQWTEENFGGSIRYYHHGNIFYFVRKTDAVAFKLMWEE